MQNESFVFTAINIEDARKKKFARYLYMSLFIVSVTFGIVSLITGEYLRVLFFLFFAITNGMRLLPPKKQVPITLSINKTGFELQNAESDKYHDWKEVKLAQYNGRYLDVFWGSSFRKSIDLQMFSAIDQLEILKLAGRYLGEHNVFISERKPIAQVVA